MRMLKFPLLVSAVSLAAFSQTVTPDVGSGAPSVAIQNAYQQAFFRNGFMNLVILPPLGNVKAFGGMGLVQEFADAKVQNNKFALIKANASTPVTQSGGNVFQVYPGLYSYYITLGASNAGFPVTDSLNCPNLTSVPGNSCMYQLFDKPYALFVYKTALLSGSVNFATRDPFYTRWQVLGGINTAGPATSAEQAITAASGIAATLQTFDQAAVFNIMSGTLAGRLVGVGSAVYAAYAAAGGYSGFLGLPVSDESLQPSGAKRQTFEGGFVEYTPGSPAIAKHSIQDLVITPGASSIRLNLGDSITLTAMPFDALGNALMDRPVVWSTSNSRVVSIQASGQTAFLKAIGGGSATVTASAEGKASIPLSVFVLAPCCGLGEGAPTPAVQQAFQDAVTRNRITVRLPTSGPVQRAGNGYVQNVQDAATGAAYLIAISDRSSAAYILGGAILSQYLALGGPSGSLGYAVSDITPGGRQLFENQAALAGSPPQLVSGGFLTKWASLNYETGSAGPPQSGVSSVLSFRASMANLQVFGNGLFVQAQAGPSAGQVFFVTGLALTAYLQAGGAAGSLGLPLDDEFAAAGKRRQDFEGGFIDYGTGDAAAAVHPGDRHPAITATPTQPLAGSRVRLAIGGFDRGSTVRVSVSGQPDFTVKTDSGAYVWEAAVPANASAAAIKIHAVDLASSAAADGSYTVRSPGQVVFQVVKVSGDGQTGSPGSVLSQPLRILVRDESGNTVPGLAVSFQASPGAQILSASSATDLDGQAQAILRLPPTDSVALVTATAGRQFVTFNAQSTHASLLNFPHVSQVADLPLGNGTATITQQGSMLASTAAILRFYQNSGALPNTNGLADPVLLNQFLQSFCALDSQGAQICDGFVSPPGSREQFVNLWRLAAFVGGGLDVSIENKDVAAVRDLVGQGSPALLALALTAAGVSSGSHFVVATGVASDGSILIMDPDPAFGRGNLNEYLSGFTAGGVSWKATLAGAVRLLPHAPVSRGFAVIGNAAFSIVSPAGSCGAELDVPSRGTADFHMGFCDGARDLYELDVAGAAPFRLTLTDLGNPGNRVELAGSGAVAYTVSRAGNLSGNPWTATPASLNFTSAGVVDAASFGPGLAPGTLFTAFGSGLTAPGAATTIEVGGVPAPVVAQSPFQVSGQIPLQLAPGLYSVHISSPNGTLEQPVTIQPVAPAIFTISGNAGAILNQNGTLNTWDNPAKRGEVVVIFGTGLGAVADRGALKTAQAPVRVILQGLELTPAFAGLAPGFSGLYQVNVSVPLATPPGLNLSLYLQQNGVSSNPVEIAVQ